MSSQEIHPVVAALRQIRRSRDILQRELAETTGYRRETFSQWEKGHRVPSLDQVQDWADALGYSIGLEERE